MVCDIRGWERIKNYEKSEELQNAIGETIVKLLNEYETLNYDEEQKETDAVPSTEKVVHFEWV